MLHLVGTVFSDQRKTSAFVAPAAADVVVFVVAFVVVPVLLLWRP